MSQPLERRRAKFFFGVAKHLAQHSIGSDPFPAHSQQGQTRTSGVERQAIILLGKVDVFDAVDFYQVRGLLRFVVELHTQRVATGRHALEMPATLESSIGDVLFKSLRLERKQGG